MRALKLLLLFTVFAFSPPAQAVMCFDGTICTLDAAPDFGPGSRALEPLPIPVRLDGELYPTAGWGMPLRGGFTLVLDGALIPARYQTCTVLVVGEPARISPAGPPPGFPWIVFLQLGVGVAVVAIFIWLSDQNGRYLNRV